MPETYGQVGPPDPKPGGSLGRPWKPRGEIVPCEVRPSKVPLVLSLIMLVIILVAVLTQRDTSGGFLVVLGSVGAVAMLLIAVRSVVAKVRLDSEQIVRTDLFGKRRLPLQEMDRPVVVQPRRRSNTSGATKGYELAIRRLGGSRPWLYATAAFWEQSALERLARTLGAPRSSAATRADVEERYPGATTWFIRRTSTQRSIALGVLLMVSLVLWQSR